jgi:hypothetical protein
MPDDNIVQLVLQAKDLATQAIEALKKATESLPATEQAVNAKLTALRMEGNAFVAKLTNDRVALAEMEKQKNLATLKSYYDQGAISAKQFSDGVAAANTKALKSAAEPTWFDKIKANWLALSAAAVAAYATISEAADLVNLGAKALQSEESFRQVTTAYGVDGDVLLKKMKEVSLSMIDDSAMMQRAVKALQQGISADQIVQILEMSRGAARTAGSDIESAFDGITNAIANQQTRGLKNYGIIIDQTKAFEDQARKLNINKDALSEYQQTQALAAASIEEGTRQLQAYGDMHLTAAEKLKQSKTQLEELKETIGKGLVAAMQIAGGGFFLVSSQILSWLSQIEIRLAAFLDILPGTSSLVKKLSEDAAAAQAMSNDLAEKGAKIWEGVGPLFSENTKKTNEMTAAQKAQADQAAASAAAQRDAAEKVKIAIQQQKEASELLITQKKAEAAVFESTMNYEIALEKKKYDEGRTSFEEYTAFVTQKQQEFTEKMIELKELEIQTVNNDQRMNETDRAKKIAEVEAEIIKIRQDSITTQLRIQENGYQEDLKNTETLGELKLQSLKASLDLLNTTEEAAMKMGLVSQTQFLADQLDRIIQYDQARIDQAIETENKIAAHQGTDSEAYKRAAAERMQLQADLEGKIIQSEANIAESMKKDAQDSAEFMSKYVDNRIQLENIAFNAELSQLDAYYQAGLVKTEDYETAREQIVADHEANILHIMTTAQKQYVDGLTMLMNEYNRNFDALNATVKDLASTDYSDVRAAFRGIVNALAMDYKSMSDSITEYQQGAWHNLWSVLSEGLLGSAQQLYLYGKNVTKMSADQVQQWAEKVREYVQKVQDLFNGLKDLIRSYQDQLDSLKGNEMAILDRWYADEIQKLKDKYGEEFAQSKEYQEALLLLEELYAEKRKKILEDEQKAKEAAQQTETESANAQKSKAAGGYGGSPQNNSTSGGNNASSPVSGFNGLAGVQSLLDGISSSMQASVGKFAQVLAANGFTNQNGEMTLKKELNVGATVELKGDVQSAERYAKDVLIPIIKKQLALEGITLK